MQLIFKAVTLQNFGSFVGIHSFPISRSQGLYFITGKNNVEINLTSNGCGKSTLFNAIFYALTGKTLRLQRPGSAIESWNTTGPVSVALSLEIDGVPYLIYRSRRPNVLEVNESTVEQSYINNLIRLNEETLKRTILVGQFVPLFLDLKPEQQSSLFTDALNLDLWLKASEKASQTAKQLENNKFKLDLTQARLRGKLSQIQEQYENECNSEKNFDQNKKLKLESFRQELLQHRQQLKLAIGRFKRLQPLESVEPVVSTAEEELRAVQALERKATDTAAEANSKYRIAERDQLALQRKVDHYSTEQKICRECGQVIDTSKADTIRQKLMLELTQVNQELLLLKTADNDARGVLNELRQHQEELQIQSNLEGQSYLESQRELHEVTKEKEILELKVQQLIYNADAVQRSTNPYTKTCEVLAQQFYNDEQEMLALKGKIEAIESDISIYRMWTSAYKEIRLNLIDETLEELQIAANRHIQTLGLDNWQIEFKTERENKSGTISHSFTILIYPGQPTPIAFESYSGGETQRLQLAVTAALSEILLNRAGIQPNIEIYDEPSKGLSKEGITDLLEYLRERAYELNRTIFFVDHNSLESGYFDSVITITKNSDGSHITAS